MPASSVSLNSRSAISSYSASEVPNLSRVGRQVLNVKNSTICLNMGLKQLHSKTNKDLIDPPVYSVKRSRETDLIYNQISLDKYWDFVQNYLINERLSQPEMEAILSSGILYTRTGSSLARLFVDAAIRSIGPEGDSATDNLRVLLEAICCFPPDQWGSDLLERLQIPQAAHREDLAQLLPDTQWQSLKKLIEGCKPFIGPWLEGTLDSDSDNVNQLDSTLSKLEEFLDDCPTAKDAKSLLGEFLDDLGYLKGRENFPDQQKRALYELWQSIDLPLTPSSPSLILNGVQLFINSINSALDALRALSAKDVGQSLLGKFLDDLGYHKGRENFPDQQKRALYELWQITPSSPSLMLDGVQLFINSINSALDALRALSAKDVGHGLYSNTKSTTNFIAKTLASFASRTSLESSEIAPVGIKNEGGFTLLSALMEIERKGDFFDDVDPNGLRDVNTFAAKIICVMNVLKSFMDMNPRDRVGPPPPKRLQITHVPKSQKPHVKRASENTVSSVVALSERVEQFAQQFDHLLSQATGLLTCWHPAAGAVKNADTAVWIEMMGGNPSQANVHTPFLPDQSTSSYDQDGNPYRNAGEQLSQAEQDTLATLRTGLENLISQIHGYTAAAGVAILDTVIRHPRKTVGMVLLILAGAATELYTSLFGDSTPNADKHFAQEDDPVLRKYISDDVGAILSEMPEVVESIKARLEASSFVDPRMDPQLIPDIKLLLSERTLSQPDQTIAELVDERVFESRTRYAHLQISRMVVDEDGREHIETEDIPANSERQAPADDSAQWVLEALSDAEITLRADQDLKARLLERLETNHSFPLSVPKDSSMGKPLAIYQQTLNEPNVLAWFESKGLVLDTLCIHEHSVSGTVIRDGVSSTQTFSLWDTSGWWQASGNVLAARQVVDPGDFGMPFMDDDQNLVPCAVILDFFMLVPPSSDEQSRALAERLGREGWPEITSEEKAAINEECEAVTELIAETKSRAQLLHELKTVAENLSDQDPVSLSGRFTRSANHLPLADKCSEIVEDLNAFLTLPKMMEVCKGTGNDCTDRPVRISDNKIQVLNGSQQWCDLTSLVTAQSTLKGPFDELLRRVRETGNVLYSTLSTDLQQVVDYRGFGSPKTAGEVRNVMQWLNTTLPIAPPLGDYGVDLLADTQSLIKLTPADRALIISQAKGFFTTSNSIIDVLGADLLSGKSVEYRRSHVDELLGKMLAEDQSDAWGKQLLRALNWYEAEQAPIPEHGRKLLLAAIKLSVDPDASGKPGTVAGYDVYQAKNLGRNLTTVRAEIEQYLVDHKGVSALAAPLVAHLFLADAAPEFLVQDPGKGVEIGTANWMTLRLGVAIAEILNPGCSRAMTTEQLMALALLVPTTPEQRLLFKSAAVDILMTWGVMNGVVQPRGESSYSPADYTLVANRFATQRAELSEAIEGSKRSLVTRKEIAVRELKKIFSFLTTEPIEEIKIKADVWEPLDKFKPIRTVEKSLVEAYMDGDLFTLKWKVTGVPIEDAVFKRGVDVLPDLNKLLTASVDSYFNSRKNALVTSTKYVIAGLPLEDRQCLEQGEVKFFTLREETGKPKEDETAQIRATFRGRQGTLLRCKYQQKISYFEIFPGHLSIIKRTDLPDDLPLNGVIKIEKVKVSKGPAVNVDVQRGTELPFDFAAYSEGSEPIPGAKSKKLIIEPLGSTLLARAVQRGGKRLQSPTAIARAGQRLLSTE
ncbi:hypothetical protein [Pseudomonas putida]|uniref:hypothetical protein n=1 Tax=Pseudomonas putida TaxID=303 RepID=UPI003D99AFFD